MNGIDGLLQADDQVEQLTDFEIMDVWVRMQLAHKLDRKLDHKDSIETKLYTTHSGYLRQAAVEIFGRESEAVDLLSWEDEASNVINLFEAWTKFPESDATKADVARAKIKQTLRGCGMARHKVARKRVQYYAED